MDIEAVAARALKAALGVPAYLEAPKEAPEEFITVEATRATGGFTDRVALDIDCLAPPNSRKRAKALAERVMGAVPGLCSESCIFAPAVANWYRMNEPDTNRSRYVVQVELTVCE